MRSESPPDLNVQTLFRQKILGFERTGDFLARRNRLQVEKPSQCRLKNQGITQYPLLTFRLNASRPCFIAAQFCKHVKPQCAPPKGLYGFPSV